MSIFNETNAFYDSDYEYDDIDFYEDEWEEECEEEWEDEYYCESNIHPQTRYRFRPDIVEFFT